MAVFALAQAHMWPELANALGFVVAFGVSFAGHRLLSFKDAGTSMATSLRRFGVTALAGFASNEIMFVVFRCAGWRCQACWRCFALVFAAAQTFVLSRFWAFRR